MIIWFKSLIFVLFFFSILYCDILETSMNKLLILIMNSDLYPSNSIIPFIKKTYMKKEYAQLAIGDYEWPKFKETSNSKDLSSPIIIFQAGSNEQKFQNNILYLNIAKDLETQAERTLATFEWVLENIDFDIIYRTTTTSYINLQKIYEHIEDIEPINFYSAPEVKHQEKDSEIKFGSGAGYFLSRDLIKTIVENKNKWDFELLDDVALGKLLNNLGKKLTPTTRQDFINYPTYSDIDFNQFHYRFRLDLYGYPRFLEVLVLLSIHQKLEYLKSKEKILRYKIKIFDIFNIAFFRIFRFFNIIDKYKRTKKKLRKNLKSILN